jgi:hypothetical protein
MDEKSTAKVKKVKIVGFDGRTGHAHTKHGRWPEAWYGVWFRAKHGAVGSL